MVKTLKRPGLLLLPCCCSGLRSTSMEQKSLAVNGPRRTLSTQNVTGLNPACDLFWMSYPRCIQSFWPLCCCVCQQSTHVIKMLSCWIYTIPLDHLEAASLSICKTDSKKFQRECGAFEHMIWWQIISDIRSSDIGQEIWRRFILVPGWFAQWKLDGATGVN